MNLKIRKEKDGTFTVFEEGSDLIWENQIKTIKEADSKLTNYVKDSEDLEYTRTLIEKLVYELEDSLALSYAEAVKKVKEVVEDM